MPGYLSSKLNKPNWIIINYPAIHSKVKKGYDQFCSTTEYNEFKMEICITMHALE
jgi:hypothetical protein